MVMKTAGCDIDTVMSKAYEHIEVLGRYPYRVKNKWKTKSKKKYVYFSKYFCKCKYCGDEFTRLAVSMKNPKCNCLRFNKKNETFENKKFCEYQGTSRKLGRIFELSRETFVNIINQPCTYCGLWPAFGIDRVDTSLGYTIANSAPCCRMCNKAKWDFNVTDFKQHVKQMYTHLWGDK